MITRYKRITSLVKRPARTLSSVAKTKDAGEHVDASILEWVTTPSISPPPRYSTHFTFTYKPPDNFTISTTNSSTRLTPEKAMSAMTTLLPPSLKRAPSPLPPLSIEYSSPNIAKPLHMGHLRSTITGSYVRNISEFAGHKCKSVCFLGDWGRQFGILHAGVLDKMRFSKNPHFTDYVSSLSLQTLLSIYVESSKRAETDTSFLSEAMRLSADLETTHNTDSDSSILWTHTRNLTVNHLKSCYSTLGISFDDFEGESTYKRDSKETQEALNILESMNLTTRHEDGSLRVKIHDTEAILLKRDDSSVYLLRDIACAIQRKRSSPDNSRFVYVVDQGQATHFKTLFNVLNQLGVYDITHNPPFSSSHIHVPFGKVTGMSTRSGTYVLLSNVIDQGTSLMHENRAKSKNARNLKDISVSEKLAVSGLIINALKVRRNKSYSFDWGDALRSNGNSGVQLQYTVSRLESLVRRVCGGNLTNRDCGGRVELLFGAQKQAIFELLVCLMNFEDTFWRSYESLEPCILVSYAFNLSDKVSTALASVKVLKETDKEVADAALWLFYVSKLTLEDCLRILGVPHVGEF